MTAPIVRLEHATLETLRLDYEAGYVVQALDPGDPVTRVVTHDRVNAHGTDDTTSLIGARTMTLQLALLPSVSGLPMETMRRRVRAFTRPDIRPIMYFTLAGQPELMAVMRRSNFRSVVQLPGHAPVTVQWVVPSGVYQSANIVTVLARASGAGAELGRTYDLSFPRDYPASPVLGSATAVNDGDVDAYPLIRIYGPCTNPAVSNITQGRTLEFTALTINSGEYLEINTESRTIRYQGNADDSRYHNLLFPQSDWWSLSPGTNILRYEPATSSPPSEAQFEWRHPYL